MAIDQPGGSSTVPSRYCSYFVPSLTLVPREDMTEGFSMPQFNVLLFHRPMFHASGCRRRPIGPRRFFSFNILQSLPGSLARKAESPLVMECALPQARSVAASFFGWKLYHQRHRYTRKTGCSPVGQIVHCWSQCGRHEVCSLQRGTGNKGKQGENQPWAHQSFQ